MNTKEVVTIEKETLDLIIEALKKNIADIDLLMNVTIAQQKAINKIDSFLHPFSEGATYGKKF